MINQENIEVLLGLKDWIAEGLKNGSLERVGGVIRDKVANQYNLKPIRAWLREGQMINLEQPSAKMLEQLSQLGIKTDIMDGKLDLLLQNSNILMGMQVANIAINVAGFAILYYKMDRIENKLNEVNSRLISLQQGQERAEIREMICQLAPVVSAMESLSNAGIYKNRQLAENRVLFADNDMAIAQRYFHGLLLHILDRKSENPAEVHIRFEELMGCYRAWIAASQGRLQAHAILDETGVAYRMAKQLKSDHAYVGEKIREVIGDTDTKLALGRQGESISSRIEQFVHQAAGVHEIIKGNVLQLEYQKDKQLILPAANDETFREHDGFVVYMPMAA